MHARSARVLLSALLLLLASPASARDPAMHATGTFDLSFDTNAPEDPNAAAVGFQRLSLRKVFQGGFSGTSRVEMLAQGDGKTCGGYVALEALTGTLDGRDGGFAMMHSSGMRDGTPGRWTIRVVPGSGTGALAGIDGELRIRMEGRQHHYDFDYTLPGP